MRTFVCIILLAGGVAVTGAQNEAKKKPSINVRASPSTGFSPLRVVLTAELKGGADDHPDYYCPTVEWIWDDDTRTETSADCDPYEPGKSEIKRRYTVSRIFHTAGNARVEFRLKQKDKVVASGGTRLAIRPGIRDGGACCDDR